MVTTLRLVALLSALCLLAACGSRSGGGPAAELPPGTLAPGTPAPATPPAGSAQDASGKTPAQLYSEIARLVRACWLNARNPVLRGYVFRAEAGAGGKSGTATNIVIYQKTRDSKLGLRAFKIDFVGDRKGTRVVAENLKLPEPQGQKFIRDVAYWAQGGTNCDAPAVAAGNPVAPPR